MNAFDDPEGVFVVLVNDEGQCSLWPTSVDLPRGWRVARGEGSRQECREFVESSWQDLRSSSAPPASPEHEQVSLIHELVAEQARRSPDAIALSSNGTTVTYRALDAEAEALAGRLRAAGVGGGALVAVALGRSLPLFTALLAVLKAGGAYLHVDPAEPVRHRRRMLADSAVRFAVGALATIEVVSEIEQVVCLDDETADRYVARIGDDTPITPDTAMYACYTSGSTGEPRGVVVPHRAVVRLVENPWWIDLRVGDVFLQQARVGFDGATFEIWTALARGHRLALAPQGHADLGEISDIVSSEKVTILLLTTGLFHKMVDHQLDGLSGVRHLLVGGDVLSPVHVERLRAAYPDLILTNGYGPTENTVFTTCWTTRTTHEGPRVPIGRAVDGTTTMVLDDELRPVQAGDEGELWVGGAGMAVGYLHRPWATAEKFVASVDKGRPGTRMYRTGDLVVANSTGDLDFVGRVDRQVKIRGYRVEPSTVELELMVHPKVRQAVTLARKDGAGDVRLVAYVAVGELAPNEQKMLGNELRGHLQEKLPDYLVPWAIFPIPDIPLDPNGKADRSALPIVRMPRNIQTDYVAPRNDLEAQLAKIWEEALEIAPIGVTDDFFDLGGHSLLATELLAGLQKSLGVAISARTLFLSPTIEILADHLSPHPSDVTSDRAQG